ncbi:MAG: type I pullulanase [Lachnospiraceae bacterium]|nr:type I pullulanase [Lachnospiraceae bacterium]
MNLKRNYQKVHTAAKKIVVMIVVFALVLGMIPTATLTFAAENTAENTVSVYFNNTQSKWSSVYGYAWKNSGTTLLGSWPGTKLSELNGQAGYYKLTCEYTPQSGSTFNYIFNNNSGSQTGNLTISNDVLTADGGPQVDGRQVTFTYESTSASKVMLAGSMNEWSTTATKMEEENNVFTYTTELTPGIYEYKYVVDGKWINDPENPLLMVSSDSNTNNIIIVTGLEDSIVRVVKGTETELPSQLDYVTEDGSVEEKEVTYSLKTADASDYIQLNENRITVSRSYAEESIELTAETEDGQESVVKLALSDAELTECPIKIHFVNALGWDSVYAHTWKELGEEDETISTWPGNALAQDEDNSLFYTLEVDYLPVEDESLGYFFHNGEGTQTTDLSVSYEDMILNDSVELWVVPDTTDEEGKYVCSVLTTAPDLSDIIISPEVNGTQVTFRYQDSTSAKVALAGTMNGWSTTANSLTKDENGIFTCTVDLEPGIYQYKYVLGGTTWINDPQNPTTVGKDSNSVVVVSDQDAVDKNEVTVKLHYSRNDVTYTGWNAWMWLDGQNGAQYDFVEEDGEMVASITVNGRENSVVNYIIRKSIDGEEWSEKEGEEDRSINIGNVLSGTVHYYVNSGSVSGTKVLGPDAITGNKIKSADYDYETGKVVVETSLPLSGEPGDSFTKVYSTDTEYTVTEIVSEGCIYTLTLDKAITLGELYKNYKLTFEDYDYDINTSGIYASDKFAEEYTYDGDDLGAVWSEEATTFKVWAPTAETVKLNLYTTGSDEEEGAVSYGSYTMAEGEKGVWSIKVTGNLKNIYYTYSVTTGGETEEACDPYAKATGVNGERAMVVDLDSTDPEGWDEDVSPNKDMEYTDAIIYELHVRDFSIDDSSGVSEANQGKYLAFTEKGTTTENGVSTGIDYLKDLGITHLHLLPVYDYGSVDETKLDTEQFNWGYDPVNYNVPEGSYSTNPYDGNVRVNEMKQMIQSLHDNGINVIMDVVYNHVYDADTFCFNEIVPGYFSRTNADGSYSNGSGCGNDTASEREMVRKYIVDSVMYWAEEYHIDGFRFDLVGLLDTETINEVVDTVHEKYPDTIFYGEGWTLGTAVEEGYTMATQANAAETPDFAYFNDTTRNILAGTNGQSTGFVSGLTGVEETISQCFTATTAWCPSPTQTVNYVSCHDNYTLMDKLKLTRSDASQSDLIKMNNLAAAVYMTSQGISFIHAGEEFLRDKVDENGKIIENSYNSSDYVNKLRWDDLENDTYADVSDYYKGLIQFRKNHAALRLTTAEDVAANVKYKWITNEVLLFDINGKDSISDEVSDGIVVIFNASAASKTINLTNAGVEAGEWKVCIDDENAGIEVLDTITNGQVTVDPISAMVLVMGETVDTDSVYTKNQGSDISPADELRINSVTASLESPQTKGTTVKFTVDAEGGEGTLQYCFYRVKDGITTVFRDYKERNWANANPGTAGTYTIYVDVKDEAGNVVTEEMTYTWNPEVKELEIHSFEASLESPQTKGTTVKFTVDAEGGEGTLQYRFYRVKDGTTTVFRDYKERNWANANPGTAGTYTIYVDVKDEAGNIVTKSMEYTWELP